MAIIKGITIEIDGNTTALTSALKKANTEIKSTSAQLKDVERLLKLDPHNTELLAQKQRLLGEQIHNTKDKLETLRTAADQAAERMSSGDKEAQEQYEALRREIIQNENNLKKLETEADQTGDRLKESGKDGKKSLDETGEAADKASSKVSSLGKAGKVAGGALAAGMVAVKAAAIAVVKGLSDITVGAAQYADDILTMSTKTGIGTDFLQSYAYAAELVDVSLDTLTRSMSKNIKSMANAAKGSAAYTDAYTQLGVAVTDADGKLRDSETVFWETIDALGKIDDETERDALAMQLFGKSAQELNPLIEKGSEGIAALTKEAKEMGAVMDEETLVSLVSLDDSLQRIKSGVTAAKNTLGAALAPQFKEVADGLVGIIGDVTNGLKDAGGDWNAVASTLSTGFAKAFDLVSDKLGNMLSVIAKASPQILKTIGDLLKKVGKQLAQTAPEIIDVLVDMLPDLLTTVGEIVGEVGAAVIEKLPEILAGIAKGIVTGGAAILKSFTDIFSDTDEILEESQKNLDDYANSFDSFSKKISDSAEGMLNFVDLVSASGKTASEIDNDIQTAEDAIYEILKTAFDSQQGLRDEDIENIRKYNDQIRELEKEKIGIYQGVQQGVLTKAELYAEDGMTAAQVVSIVGEAQTAFTEASSAIQSAYTQELTHLKNELTMGFISQDVYDTEVAKLRETYDDALAATTGYYNSVIAIVEDGSEEWAQFDADAWKAIGEKYGSIVDNCLSDLVIEYDSAGDKIKTMYADALRSLDIETANAYLSIEAEMINGGGKLDAAAKDNIRSIISVFDGLPDGLDETGRSALNALIAGLNFPELSNAASMSTDEIVTVLKNKFDVVGETGEELGESIVKGVDSKQSDMVKSGEFFYEGYVEGIRKGRVPAYNAGTELFECAQQGLRDAAQESSPSKVMQISGGFFAEGYEIGIRKKTPDAVAAAADIVNLSLEAIKSVPAAAAMPDYGTLTGNTSNVTNNNSTMHIAGITVNVSAPNVDSVEDLADLVADRINDSILGKAAMYA